MASIAKKTSRRKMMANKEALWAYIFLTPIIVGFIVFTIFPVAMSFYYSLTKYDGILEPQFVGLQNYINILKNDEFRSSLWNTCYYTLGTVPLGTFIALCIAVALNQKIRFMEFYRAAFFIPVIVSTVAVAMVWQWMYNTDYGIINSILGFLGLYQPPWLASAQWAMPSVIIMSIWKNLGFNTVILVAGLQGISPSVYEAAEIDGASGFQVFFRITIPLLRHTVLFALIIAMIGAFQAFDQIYVMTRGGPAKATQVVVYLIYQNAFNYFKQGLASAMAYVLFIIIFIGSIIQMRISDSKDV